MFKLFKSSKTNVNATVGLLLKVLNVKISSNTLNNTLEDHPDYPNLLSISESLTEWHVPNQAYQINKEDYDPNDLEFPFIAHLHLNGGRYILIHTIINHQIIYSDEIKKNNLMIESDFLKLWSGVALHATVTEKSGEAEYNSNYIKDVFSKLKLPLLIITGIAGIVLSLNYQTINFNYGILLILKLIGIAVSALLLMYSINANNPFIQNLCSLGGKNDCNAILKSDAAKVTSWLSWSEVGFFYFTGSFLSLLFVPLSLAGLAWLNLLALPYTIYSLTYQYKNKNWCVLCCTVQALLLGEFLVNSLTTNAFNFDLSTAFHLIPSVLFSFALPILTWSVIKPILLKSTLTKPLKQQLKKFKYNSDLFKQVLHSQPKYGIGDDLMPINLGNPDAETVITMVSNPFCGPCAKAHQVIDEWLSYRDDIQLKIIFTTADHEDDEKTKISRHISTLSLLNDAQLVAEALNDWYKQNTKKYEDWAIKYPIIHNDTTNEITKKQKAWCDLTEITFTPTIFINGYKLPNPYRLEDMKYLLS
jgi:protein-disulfide isomerase